MGGSRIEDRESSIKWADGRYNRSMVHRSKRVPEDLSFNRLAVARERIGAIPFDLTISNPTACGISYPTDLLAGLADPRGLAYEPDPRGSLATRNVVAAGYERWGVTPDPRRIVLTASTSEAYGFLFRLFCDPGEAVLVPSPSYPLFEHLARLDGIEAPTYALDADAGWRIDFSTLEDCPALVRAVVVVHPNKTLPSMAISDRINGSNAIPFGSRPKKQFQIRIQLFGTMSPSSFFLYHLFGAIITFFLFSESHAAHQLNELLAIMK